MLEANLPRVQARRLLDEVDAGKLELGPQHLYRVALTATGSEEVANVYRSGQMQRDAARRAARSG